MKRVGVTGGIGSGKSTVCSFFEYIGVPVYYSDLRARDLMNLNIELKGKLIETFSDKCYLENGELNRPFLSKEVFSSPDKLALLNSVVHPAVYKDFMEWSEAQFSDYVIIESAILCDIGWDKLVDYVLAVSAPKDLRVHRVMSRDGVSSSEVERRIASQLDEAIRLERCDAVIHCDDSRFLISQILDADILIRGIF